MYEYQVICGGFSAEELEKELNGWGQQGYRVVSAGGIVGGSQFWAVLERSVEVDASDESLADGS